MQTFADLLEQHAARTLEKQRTLSNLLGQHRWDLNLLDGRLNFTLENGEVMTSEVQLVGTESFETQTWLWSWANKQSNIPLKLLRAVMELQEYGVVTKTQELTTDMLELVQVPAHELAMVATGFADADAYYRGDYGAGAVYCLLKLPELRPHLPNTALEASFVMGQLVSEVNVNHKRAFSHFVKSKGWRVATEEHTISAQAGDGSRIEAQFDALDRLVNLETR